MVDFYTRAFGLLVTDRGRSPRGFEIAFLSGRPDEHHQLAIAAGRANEATFSTINQVSFRVKGLDDLKRYYTWLTNERVSDLEARNHGNAWSFYFSDPEGNRMEVYCSTPWYVSQPFGEPLDLSEPNEAILATTGAMVRADPTSQRIEAWSADMRKRLGQASSASGVAGWLTGRHEENGLTRLEPGPADDEGLASGRRSSCLEAPP
jgi:catechol 2,3-dioxygenase